MVLNMNQDHIDEQNEAALAQYKRLMDQIERDHNDRIRKIKRAEDLLTAFLVVCFAGVAVSIILSFLLR